MGPQGEGEAGGGARRTQHVHGSHPVGKALAERALSLLLGAEELLVCGLAENTVEGETVHAHDAEVDEQGRVGGEHACIAGLGRGGLLLLRGGLLLGRRRLAGR